MESGLAGVIFIGCAMLMFLPESQEHSICNRYKMFFHLEEKINQLKEYLSILHCIQDEEEYQNKSYKMLVLERSKGKEKKWQHVTQRRALKLQEEWI